MRCCGLGQGFLQHPENQVLRDALHHGTLTPSDYFQQLLRLVYRLIFPGHCGRARAVASQRRRPVRRIAVPGWLQSAAARDRSTRRSAHDRFSDLWEGLRIVFRALSDGETRLGLPALAGLYSPSQCAYLDASRLHNRALLQAVFRLTWLREPSVFPVSTGATWDRKSWAASMKSARLVPQITQGDITFSLRQAEKPKAARASSVAATTPPKDSCRCCWTVRSIR